MFLNMDFLFVLYVKKNQVMINGKEKVINGYFIEIMLGMLLMKALLMNLLKIVGKILEEVMLNNGILLIGFVVFAVILPILFMIIFLITQEQMNIN